MLKLGGEAASLTSPPPRRARRTRYISHTREKTGLLVDTYSDAFLNRADTNRSPLVLTKKYAVN